MNWEGGELFLEKMCGDYAKFTDNDFAKLTSKKIIIQKIQSFDFVKNLKQKYQVLYLWKMKVQTIHK